MSFVSPVRHFNQKATYWAQKKQSGYGGENWDPPQIIDCRWEDVGAEVLSVAYKVEGETIVSDAHVFTKVPLKVGGYLYKGETTEENPARLKNPNAFVIRKTTTIPSLRAGFAEHIALL